TSHREALELIQEPSRIDPYRIVLATLDAHGSDSLALVERIRALPDSATIRVLLMTSSAYRHDPVRTRKLSIDAYLVKPIRMSELRDTLLRCVEPSAERLSARPEPSQEALATHSGLNILIAEDNRVNQVLMRRLLEKRGHKVTIAETGKAVLTAWESQAFDLILMDVQMPELDGFEATAEIRRREAAGKRRIPIVALTAHAMAGDRDRCLASGMDAYLTKPIDPKVLDETLEQYRRKVADPEPAAARSALLP